MNESYQHPGKWQDIILIPTVSRTSGNHFLMSHVIRGLEHNSVYEAIVQAKNRYGWNEVIALTYLTKKESKGKKMGNPLDIFNSILFYKNGWLVVER